MDDGDPVRRLFAVLAVLLVSSCGPPTNVEAPRPVGGLLLACKPSDAMVFVDDRYVGTVRSLKGRAVRLPEGVHRLEVRRAGYFAHFAEVAVVKGVRQKLHLALRREPF